MCDSCSPGGALGHPGGTRSCVSPFPAPTTNSSSSSFKDALGFPLPARDPSGACSPGGAGRRAASQHRVHQLLGGDGGTLQGPCPSSTQTLGDGREGGQDDRVSLSTVLLNSSDSCPRKGLSQEPPRAAGAPSVSNRLASESIYLKTLRLGHEMGSSGALRPASLPRPAAMARGPAGSWPHTAVLLPGRSLPWFCLSAWKGDRPFRVSRTPLNAGLFLLPK